VANQRAPSPVHADVREKPVLYLIPFAGPVSGRSKSPTWGRK
jgi:hypothetical protein